MLTVYLFKGLDFHAQECMIPALMMKWRHTLTAPMFSLQCMPTPHVIAYPTAGLSVLAHRLTTHSASLAQISQTRLGFLLVNKSWLMQGTTAKGSHALPLLACLNAVKSLNMACWSG